MHGDFSMRAASESNHRQRMSKYSEQLYKDPLEKVNHKKRLRT